MQKRNMRKYKAYNEKAMRKSTKIAALIAGVGLIILGILTTARYSIPVGVIILLATVMDKETYVTEEGIEVVYDLFAFKHVDKWSFDDISDIHKEEVPDKRFYVLHFMKEVMSRRLVFYREESDKVVEMAMEKNGNIHFADVNTD